MSKLSKRDQAVIEYVFVNHQNNLIGGLDLSEFKDCAFKATGICLNSYMYSANLDKQIINLFLAFLNRESSANVGAFLQAIIKENKIKPDSRKKYKALRKVESIANSLIDGSYKVRPKFSFVSYATVISMLFIGLMLFYLVSKNVKIDLYHHINSKYFSVESTEDKLWLGFLAFVKIILTLKVWVTILVIVAVISIFIDLCFIEDLGFIPPRINKCKINSIYWNVIGERLKSIINWINAKIARTKEKVAPIYSKIKASVANCLIMKISFRVSRVCFSVLFEMIILIGKVLCNVSRVIAIIIEWVITNFTRTGLGALIVYMLLPLIIILIISYSLFYSAYQESYLQTDKNYCNSLHNRESPDVFYTVNGDRLMKTESAIFKQISEGTFDKIYSLTPEDKESESKVCSKSNKKITKKIDK